MHHTHQHQHLLPCLHCHPHSYIRMVQHLIERCLLLNMSREQCIKALAEHANIRPLVTLTVWRELQKENKEFFHAYFRSTSSRPFPSFLKGFPDWIEGNSGIEVNETPIFANTCWTRE